MNDKMRYPSALDPISQLMREHDKALLELKKLNKAVLALSADGYSSKHFRQIESALRFVEEEVGVHNRREEKALFPILERYVEGPTEIMKKDHRRLRRGFTRLALAVRRVRKRRDSFTAIRELQAVARTVVRDFVNHIHRENYVLFPLVRRFLTKEALRQVARRML